jgi:hypothetical protein
MTKFEEAVKAVIDGKLQTPSVSYGNKQIDYFGFQLATHHFNLKLMAKGMKFKNIKFTDLKKHYGLKGKSAKDCLAQFEQIIADYKAELNKPTIEELLG